MIAACAARFSSELCPSNSGVSPDSHPAIAHGKALAAFGLSVGTTTIIHYMWRASKRSIPGLVDGDRHDCGNYRQKNLTTDSRFTVRPIPRVTATTICKAGSSANVSVTEMKSSSNH